jgi:hypothetical protein
MQTKSDCEEGQILVCVGEVYECHWVNTANTLPPSLVYFLLISLLGAGILAIVKTKSGNRRIR